MPTGGGKRNRPGLPGFGLLALTDADLVHRPGAENGFASEARRCRVGRAFLTGFQGRGTEDGG